MRPTAPPMAQAAEEDNFKVCGLCSQLVDESVHLNASLRAFLLHFLSLGNTALPAKICTDCYQGAFDSFKFRDRCLKAIVKLKNNRISDAMILGQSSQDKRDVQAMVIPAAAPAASEPGPRAEHSVSMSAAKSGPASRRAAGLTGRQKAVSVAGGGRASSAILISQDEKNLADHALQSPTGRISYRKRRTLLSHSSAWPVDTLPAVQRRLSRRGTSVSVKGGLDPLATPAPVCPPKGHTVSGYGRVRKPLSKGYVYTEEVEAQAVPSPPVSAVAAPPVEPRPARGGRAKSQAGKKRARSPAEPVPRANAKRAKTTVKTPSKGARRRPSQAALMAAKNKGSPKGTYYYIDENGQPDDELIEVEDEADEEEIFPSIGPYQCEICQDITNTKQEFVDHIKRLHRTIVDEEVLKSLENDLKKSKRAQERKAKSGKSHGKGAKLKMAPAPHSQARRGATSAPKVSCEFCDSVLASARDLHRHQKTAYCGKMRRQRQKTAKVSGAPAGSGRVDTTVNGDVPHTGKPKKMVANPLAVGPGESSLRPGSGSTGGTAHPKTHYKPKAKVAKQYELEKGINGKSPSPVAPAKVQPSQRDGHPVPPVSQSNGAFSLASPSPSPLKRRAEPPPSTSVQLVSTSAIIASPTFSSTTTVIEGQPFDLPEPSGELEPEPFTSSVTEEPVSYSLNISQHQPVYASDKTTSLSTSFYKAPPDAQSIYAQLDKSIASAGLATSVWEDTVLTSSHVPVSLPTTMHSTLDLSALDPVSGTVSHPGLLTTAANLHAHPGLVLGDLNPYGMLNTPPSSQAQSQAGLPNLFY